jgi:hypothetical protein
MGKRLRAVGAALIATWTVAITIVFGITAIAFFGGLVFLACAYVIRLAMEIEPKTIDDLGPVSLVILGFIALIGVVAWWSSIYQRAKLDLETAAKHKGENPAAPPRDEER